MYTDKELLERISEDDSAAFTILYRRHWEEMYVVAAKALREKTNAADVIQDVFLSLWNRRHELKIEGSLTNYLHTAVRYKAIHHIEKNITRRDYLAVLADVSVNWLPPNAEVDLQLEELQKALSTVVTRMPPKMQQVYILSRQQQLSHKEIAEQLSVSVETVKKHIQHALQLIKAALQYVPSVVSLLLSFFF
jgi:RNA polymerase sigma-70 factor (ECF subfamily)